MIEPRIVCDTNIWYGIGNGSIEPESFYGQRLVCTNVTLRELASTPNLYKHQDDVRKAVRAIRNYASVLILEDAFGYATNKFVDRYNADTQYGMDIMNQLKTLLNFEITVSDDNMPKVKKYFDWYSKDFDGGISEINDSFLSRKEYVRQNKLKKLIRKTDLSELFKPRFAGMLIQSHQESERGSEVLSISLASDRWREFELVAHVWTDFFKDLDVSQQKIQPNDWADILQTIYVGADDLFWTKEKKWLRLIEANPISRKYLFRTTE